jgi:hypothetical protein
MASSYRSPRDRDIYGRRKTGAANKHADPSSALRLLLAALMGVTTICSIALFWAADTPMVRCRAWPHGCYPPASVVVRFDDAPPTTTSLMTPEEEELLLDNDDNDNNGHLTTIQSLPAGLMASSTKDLGSASSARRCRATLQLRTEAVDIASWLMLPSMKGGPMSSIGRGISGINNGGSGVASAGSKRDSNNDLNNEDEEESSTSSSDPSMSSVCDVSRASSLRQLPVWRSLLPKFCQVHIHSLNCRMSCQKANSS